VIKKLWKYIEEFLDITQKLGKQNNKLSHRGKIKLYWFKRATRETIKLLGNKIWYLKRYP